MPILPRICGVRITKVRVDDQVVVLEAEAVRAAVECPRCGIVTHEIRSRYTRRLMAPAWGSQAVRLELHSRRWRCRNPGCSQQLFTERCSGEIARYSRRLETVAHRLAALGVVTSARQAAALAAGEGIPASSSPVLRLVRHQPDPPVVPPRVVGIDDWAWRKGHTYGTIVVDLERHGVIDVLPDREPGTVTQWLRCHSSVEVVSRDRAAGYAAAVTAANPHIQHIADRWHLLQNLSHALTHYYHRVGPRMVSMSAPQAPHSPAEPSPPTTTGQRHQQERFEAVQALWKQGYSLSAIGRQLHLDRTTVRKYAHAPECPGHTAHRRRNGILNPYESRLMSLWSTGIQNSRILSATLAAEGYSGSIKRVRDWPAAQRRALGVPRQRRVDVPTVGQQRAPRGLTSARAFVQALLAPWDQLPRTLNTLLSELLVQDAEFRTLWTLVHQFHTMLRHRRGRAFDAWLTRMQRCSIVECRRFAASIQKDRGAVEAGLTEVWNQGVVEGPNHRLKLLKRIGYGRAGFPLLRKRVLLRLSH